MYKKEGKQVSPYCDFFSKDRRGLSTIVTTVILILLVLVAVGVVWIVIKNIIGDVGEQASASSRCFTTQLGIGSATCNAAGDSCTVTLTKTGSSAINGVYVVFSNDAGSSDSVDISGDIELSKTSTETVINPVANPTKVVASAYINDESGNPVTCSQIAEGLVQII